MVFYIINHFRFISNDDSRMDDDSKESKFSKHKLVNIKIKMEKFKGYIKAKKKSSIKPKPQETTDIQTRETHGHAEIEYSHERFFSEVAKKLTGVNVNIRILSQLLENLQIDVSKDITDDDLFLIYNLLSEPLISRENEKNVYRIEDINRDEYEEKLLDVSLRFVDVLPNQRVNGIYYNLPSLDTNRKNFEIEKDIFRNKPLLGKGIFKCEKCGSDDTEDYEKQTRSADEPMTVFVNCRKCKARFRYG